MILINTYKRIGDLADLFPLSRKFKYKNVMILKPSKRIESMSTVSSKINLQSWILDEIN